MQEKPRLSREKIIAAAAGLADRSGLARVSMRNVGAELGVEAMSLYHYLSNKEELLDELSDFVFSQIETPDESTQWRSALELRASSTRRVLVAHPWGLGMIESRPIPGPALLKHHNSVLGHLVRAGCEPLFASQAFATLDAFVYGFVLSETSMPFEMKEGAEMDYAASLALDESEYPFLAENVAALREAGGFAFSDGFQVGLGIILDSIEARLEGGGITSPSPLR